MILLGLTGPKGCGKDTAYTYLQQWASERGVYAIRRGFADKLKLSAARIFYPEIDLEDAIEWCNAIKDDGNPANRSEIHEIHTWAPDVVRWISGRQFLQRYGTEAHRNVFGDDFWVDQLLPKNELTRLRSLTRDDPSNRYPEIVVITDTRFVNEAERIRVIGGEVWEIVRHATQSSDEHVSEAGLPRDMIDGTIINNSTLGALEATIREMADTHLVPALERQKAQP